MSEKKSKKDIAFEKERAVFRHEKRELEHAIKKKDVQILQCVDKIRELQNKISEQEDWIRRLLEYMDLTKEDFEKEIQRIKDYRGTNPRINTSIDRLTQFLGRTTPMINTSIDSLIQLLELAHVI